MSTTFEVVYMKVAVIAIHREVGLQVSNNEFHLGETKHWTQQYRGFHWETTGPTL